MTVFQCRLCGHTYGNRLPSAPAVTFHNVMFHGPNAGHPIVEQPANK